jgi:hypothetical protein
VRAHNFLVQICRFAPAAQRSTPSSLPNIRHPTTLRLLTTSLAHSQSTTQQDSLPCFQKPLIDDDLPLHAVICALRGNGRFPPIANRVPCNARSHHHLTACSPLLWDVVGLRIYLVAEGLTEESVIPFIFVANL